MIHGKQLIGGSLSALGSSKFTSHDPRNGNVVGTFFEATEHELNRAVALAKRAFPVYSMLPDKKRAEFLEAIAGELELDAENITRIYQEESGLPEGRATGELGRTVAQLRSFAGHITQAGWRSSIHHPGSSDSGSQQPELYRTSIPLGPVVVFGASNFPLAFSTAGGDTASALAAGCPVIVKGHPLHPGTGEVVASAIARAAKTCDIPEGVFSNLNGKEISLGQQLVLHPAIKGVGFTGSLEAGRALYDLAATRDEPIPVFAEMGSVNPVLISQQAMEARGSDIALQLSTSFTLGAGQFCTCPGLVLSTGFSADFKKNLLEQVEAMDTQSMLGEGLKENYLHALQSVLQTSGVEVLHHPDPGGNAGIQPSLGMVSGSRFLENESLQEEVFGPFTLLISCRDEDELHKVVEKLRGQLTLSLYAEEEELQRFEKWLPLFTQKAGRVILNAMPTGVAVSPAMTHGGPYPASTDARFTSVGTAAINRWLRPVTFQGFPSTLVNRFEN